jgi:hypothetical protein
MLNEQGKDAQERRVHDAHERFADQVPLPLGTRYLLDKRHDS